MKHEQFIFYFSDYSFFAQQLPLKRAWNQHQEAQSHKRKAKNL